MPHKRIMLKVEHTDAPTIKITLAGLIIVCLSLFILTHIFVSKQLLTAAYVLGLGVLTYEIAIFYEVKKLNDLYIKRVNSLVYKRTLKMVSYLTFTIVFAFMMFITLMSIMFFRILVKGVNMSNKALSLLAIPLVVLPIIFWNDYIKIIKKIKGILFVILIFSVISSAHALSLNETIKALTIIDNVQNLLSPINQTSMNVTAIISHPQQLISEALGTTPTQSLILLVIIFSVCLLIAVKFISTILKWVIILLILLLIIQLI